MLFCLMKSIASRLIWLGFAFQLLYKCIEWSLVTLLQKMEFIGMTYVVYDLTMYILKWTHLFYKETVKTHSN